MKTNHVSAGRWLFAQPCDSLLLWLAQWYSGSKVFPELQKQAQFVFVSHTQDRIVAERMCWRNKSVQADDEASCWHPRSCQRRDMEPVHPY